ncbi:hypothetical protein EIB18_01175 [Caulobacter vibrioides]|uniref:hypothetical protein n=1 Tax=Caulobacter vibrioides TaxID=155892 RepID=UPI000BB5090A|nr:hypothetical protein [Caulobacter vibrioides]ATC23244.1 hypothetical protein CA608_01190 [Caulobacter vibrioides]AZH11451.1 hypothetical protein EIB18_01175 [Caulobacter vibrioides]PLR13086.1 hypothetical protein CVUC_07080 [Caulobacter vibrioides]
MRRDRLLSLALLAVLSTAPLLAPTPALAGKGKDDKKEQVTYFALAPINAVILRRDGRRGVMTVETGLEIKDAKLMERAQASTPRLRAAFAQTLMVYAAGLRGGAPPDIDHMGRELQKTADQVLGKPGSKVLLTSAMVN